MLGLTRRKQVTIPNTRIRLNEWPVLSVNGGDSERSCSRPRGGLTATD